VVGLHGQIGARRRLWLLEMRRQEDQEEEQEEEEQEEEQETI